MNIDGATRLYAIIGDPVAQVRSPSVYTAHFARHDMPAVMFAAQASRDSFDTAMRGLMSLGNLDGLLITSPHKADALAFADRLSTRAQIVGAINALRREPDGSWTGDMFDGVGFVSAAQKVMPVEAKRVLLFGCGGAGADCRRTGGAWRPRDFARRSRCEPGHDLARCVGRTFSQLRCERRQCWCEVRHRRQRFHRRYER